MFLKRWTLFVLLLSFVHADTIRPAYLEVTQKTTDTYAVLLKVPREKGETLPVRVKVIEGCQEKGKHVVGLVDDAYMDRVILNCTQSIRGKDIEVQGLENAKTDLLLRLAFLDGSSQSRLLNFVDNVYTVKEEASSMQIVQTYTWLGITHILMGFDHLLFVFALLLIVKNVRRLLWTITAFTLAHSITMVGATLGVMSVPQKPVEAIIALSILFLAMEIVREKQGKVGLASRYPWVIAFIFGLLHGFGFAGALAEIGLPEQAITLALIFFNIGVELGQLMFVASVVLVAWLLRRLKYVRFMQSVEMFVVYAIGGLSAFWVFERVSTF
jgi:hydrogenase/urease accessory protein HupE